MPEDAVGAGGVVLRVGLEDLLAVNTGKRRELVRVKAPVARVNFEVSQGLAHLGEERGSGRRLFERRPLRICRGSELELAFHI